MERNVSMEEISDGKLYGLNDMVKADCQDCKGCFACCQGMGTSITLDPMDCYRLSSGLHRTVTELLSDGSMELNVVDGIILPNLTMPEPSGRCTFLSDTGRCSIHPYRPGICRLFPLGRVYEHDSFQYFLQVHECPKDNRTKVKVKKWIDTPNTAVYEQFIRDWHYYIKNVQETIRTGGDDSVRKTVCITVLTDFYLTPYDLEEDFYPQFHHRLKNNRQFLETVTNNL